MTKLPQTGNAQGDKRFPVIVRLTPQRRHELEVACRAMAWTKQRFYEEAQDCLLVKLAGRTRRSR